MSRTTYYRLQLFRERRGAARPVFLFEVWTSKPTLALPRTWAEGGRRRRRLGPGSYRWLVYPVFGSRDGLGTGSSRATSIAHGSFILGAGS